MGFSMSRLKFLAAACGASALLAVQALAQTSSPVPAGKYDVAWMCGGEQMGGTMEMAADGTGLFSYFGMGSNGAYTSGSYSVRLVADGSDILVQPQTWVDRRPGATMYPARVRVRVDRMDGSVDVRGCSLMSITRVGGGRIAAPAPPRVAAAGPFPGPPPLSFQNTPVAAAAACRARYTSRGGSWTEILGRMNRWRDNPDFFDSYVRVMQVGFAEQRYRDLLACRDTVKADTGQDLIDQARVDGWNRELQSAAQTFFARHGRIIEQDLSGGDIDGPFAKTVADSRTLSALGGRALAVGKANRDAKLAAEANAKALAAKAAAEKQAALAALAPAFGPWRKSNTFEYTRAAPAGVTARLFCDTAGGLGVALSIASGYFVNPDDVKFVNTTNLTLTSKSGPRRFKALLGYDGSSTSTTFESGRDVKVTTTFYDPRRATFAMNVPARRGDAAQALYEGSARAGTKFAEAIGAGRVADEDNAMLQLMRMTGKLTAAGLEANTINFTDIASVRNEPSLKLAVEVVGRGMVELFDLEPTKAPFSTLLKACA